MRGLTTDASKWRRRRICSTTDLYRGGEFLDGWKPTGRNKFNTLALRLMYFGLSLEVNLQAQSTSRLKTNKLVPRFGSVVYSLGNRV
jgi:hypothetical protein